MADRRRRNDELLMRWLGDAGLIAAAPVAGAVLAPDFPERAMAEVEQNFGDVREPLDKYYKEIRNPKHEIRMSETRDAAPLVLVISSFLTLELPSDFDIRISDFPRSGLRISDFPHCGCLLT